MSQRLVKWRKIMTHQNQPHLHFCTLGKFKTAQGHTNNTKRHTHTNRHEIEKHRHIQHRRIPNFKLSMNIIQALQNMLSTQFNLRRELKAT